MGYRSTMEIISQILDVANSSSSWSPTKVQIMYKAFLSYNQTTEYLKILTEDGLLSYDPATARYETTEKGLRFLELYHKIGEVILMKETEEEQRGETRLQQQQQQQYRRLLPQQQ